MNLCDKFQVPVSCGLASFKYVNMIRATNCHVWGGCLAAGLHGRLAQHALPSSRSRCVCAACAYSDTVFAAAWGWGPRISRLVRFARSAAAFADA